MAKVLFACPCYRPDERYKVSLPLFLKEVGKKHDIAYIEVWGKELVEAQNIIAEFFLKTNYEYLCLLEDDNWGHKPEMLTTMLSVNKLVASINYYSRHFPYYSCLMRFQGKYGSLGEPLYIPLEDPTGYKEVDLSGYAMMLIKREVFSILDKPYFRLNRIRGNGSYATDEDFCQRLKEKSIRPVGVFTHCLSHRDVTPKNRWEKVLEGFEELKLERKEYLKKKGYL